MLTKQENEIADRYTDRLYEAIHKNAAHILRGKQRVLAKDKIDLKKCMEETCNTFPLPFPMYFNVKIKKGNVLFGVESQPYKKATWTIPIPLVQSMDEVQYEQANTETCEEFLRLWEDEGETVMYAWYKEIAECISNGDVDPRFP